MRFWLPLLLLVLLRPLPTAATGSAWEHPERALRAPPAAAVELTFAAPHHAAIRGAARFARDKDGSSPDDGSAPLHVERSLDRAPSTAISPLDSARPPTLRAEARPYDATAPPTDHTA